MWDGVHFLLKMESHGFQVCQEEAGVVFTVTYILKVEFTLEFIRAFLSRNIEEKWRMILSSREQFTNELLYVAN